MARPSSLTAERREVAERALAAGLPLSVAAASAEVSPRTLSRWLQEGQIVRRRLAAAPEPPPNEPAPPEPDVEKVLVGVVLRAARDDWRAAIALFCGGASSDGGLASDSGRPRLSRTSRDWRNG